MPPGPGALWERVLDKANVFSSIVVDVDEDFSAGY
jgi:hypothetical protein